jgi:hypothetical protein
LWLKYFQNEAGKLDFKIKRNRIMFTLKTTANKGVIVGLLILLALNWGVLAGDSVLGASIAGDFDGSNRVDLGDFGILSAAWLSELGDGNWNEICDMNYVF